MTEEKDYINSLKLCWKIIDEQRSCIEKHNNTILMLEKRVDILTEELQANQLEISKLLNNK